MVYIVALLYIYTIYAILYIYFVKYIQHYIYTYIDNIVSIEYVQYYIYIHTIYIIVGISVIAQLVYYSHIGYIIDQQCK